MHPRGIAVRAIATRLLAAGLACLVLAPIVLFSAAGTVYAGRCNSTIHQPSLDGLTATPMTGLTSTTIRFEVVYRDTRGCEPSVVAIVIPGAGTFAMTQVGGSFKDGMTYQAGTTLPVGSWPFGAMATSGFGAGQKTVFRSGSGSIVIAKPAPTPTPTPRPTPTPTPTPVPTATPRSTPAPTPKPTKAPKPTPRPGSSGPKATPKPTRSPASPQGAGGRSPSPSSSASDDGIAGGGIAGGPGAGGDGAGQDGDSANRGPSGIVPVLVAIVVVTFGGGLLAVARRRRRPPAGPPEPDDGASQDAPPEDPTPLELGPLSPIDEALQGHLPQRPARRFDKPARPGIVRGTIAYRHVRVSAGPDDLRSAELARLEQRDEVEVIGESAGYLQVRMPDGITGWVPRMVFVTAPGPGGAG